jgi:sugar phosphate isomerase/epimerase
LGINFDPASVVSAGRSPVEVMTEWGTFLNHVMVRDAIRDGGGDSTEVPVGRGEVEWQEVLAIAYELNYRGWFCVDRTQGNDKAGDAGRAVQYVRSLELG